MGATVARLPRGAGACPAGSGYQWSQAAVGGDRHGSERRSPAAVHPIPEGYPRVTPYLCADGAAAAIDFYVSVLGATERMRMPAPGGRIGHAELQLGNSVIMLADAYPDIDFRSPKAIVSTHVEDVSPEEMERRSQEAMRSE
ncbi:VOC family protein [Streptomyces sp. WM6372]|uniref:VOC family protein n=1 Tax=Streptomyces sp. WM6372 TaxID=1415555 RepID=UPI000ACB29D0|nr:VOC family protein [Streptomyces sp. WM6372]